MTTLVLAVTIGAAFGVVLDRIGATNPGKIVQMLSFHDLHLMRTILAGIGVASILLFGGLSLGLVDVGHLSVKTAYTGVVVGGILLGVGFAVSGYCPGTGLTAAATGRIDAIVFAIGGLVGASAYMLSYTWVKSTGLLAPIAGGKTTLGAISGSSTAALFPAIPGEVLGIALGLVFIVVAWLLPSGYRSEGLRVVRGELTN